MLGRLAELSLMVAEDLAVQVRQCEDVQERAALSEAFHKVGRVMRLTLALDRKFDRDAAKDAREEAREAERSEAAKPAPPPARSAPGPIEARKTRVKNLLNRLVWNECEGDSEEYDLLHGELSARLDEAGYSPGFEDLPVEVIAQRMIADMGLCGELTLSLREAPPNREAARTPEPADSG